MKETGVLVTAKYRIRDDRGGYMLHLADAWCNDNYIRPGDAIEQRRDGEYLILRHIQEEPCDTQA